jgi:hypothetical protein
LHVCWTSPAHVAQFSASPSRILSPSCRREFLQSRSLHKTMAGACVTVTFPWLNPVIHICFGRLFFLIDRPSSRKSPSRQYHSEVLKD